MFSKMKKFPAFSIFPLADSRKTMPLNQQNKFVACQMLISMLSACHILIISELLYLLTLYHLFHLHNHSRKLTTHGTPQPQSQSETVLCTTVSFLPTGFIKQQCTSSLHLPLHINIWKVTNDVFHLMVFLKQFFSEYLTKLTDDPSKVYVGPRSEDLKRDLLSLIHCKRDQRL